MCLLQSFLAAIGRGLQNIFCASALFGNLGFQQLHVVFERQTRVWSPGRKCSCAMLPTGQRAHRPSCATLPPGHHAHPLNLAPHQAT